MIPSTSDLVARARAVDDLLASLAGELDSLVNPHRQALRLLDIDSLGHVKKLYQDGAFVTWSKLAQRQPRDLEAVHHLAIMHHARAFDREAGASPRTANPDWEAALARWTELSGADEFWTAIVDRAHGKDADKRDARRAEQVKRLRDSFAVRLLRIHFDIAFDETTLAERIDRSHYHVKLALSSRFPAAIKAQAQLGAYEAFVKDVPEAVWNPDTLDPKVLKTGTDRIEKFLTADPDCTPALADLLRLQMRQLHASWIDLQAIDVRDKARRKSLLHRLYDGATSWRPYLDRLVAQIDGIDEVDRTELRRKLCQWYRVMGMVRSELDHDDEAIAYYETGARVGDPDHDERRLCLRGIGESRATQAATQAQEIAKARDAADGEKAPMLEDRARTARAACDALKTYPHLSLEAIQILAQAYAMLDDFATASALCQKALDDPPEYDVTDHHDLELQQKGLEDIRKLLEMIEQRRRNHALKGFCDQAKELMAEDRFDEARRVLDKAARETPETVVFFLRCQCQLELRRLDDAERDLERFRRDARAPEQREAATKLEKMLREAREALRKFGREAPALRDEAADAFQKGNYATADDRLARAIEKCPATGRPELVRDRANLLSGWAEHEVQTAMTDDKSSLADKEKACRIALQRLEQAIKLDPALPSAKQNHKTLQALLAQLETAQAAEKKHRELVEHYGGEEAFELQQQAVRAFNADRTDEAIALLRQAIDAARKAAEAERQAEAARRAEARRAEAARKAGPFGRSPVLDWMVDLEPLSLLHERIGPSPLEQELAKMLNQAAVELLNSAKSHEAQRRVLERARDFLTEAVKLDFLNDNARKNLSALPD
jgi:hypothetical protein